MLSVFCSNINAQCTISGTTPNTTSYNPNPCAVLSGCSGILYIGDGINPTNLIMTTSLNLTCLGSIQLIVRNNASIDFSSGNDYLTLDVGSSISFEGTGTLIGGNCNASERIYIGTDLIASCNGQGPGADFAFPTLVSAGGFNIVKITPASASACSSGNFTLLATATPSTATEVRWYSVASGGTPLQTTSGNNSTYITPTITSTTTYYAEATIGTLITPRKSVTATINPLPNVTLSSSDADNIFCAGTSVTFSATGGTNYNFRVNNTSVQNSTSSTYTSTTLTNGQVVDVIVTNASLCTATSSGITNTVNALPTVGLTSSDTDNTFCAGTSVTFSATGGTNYNFKVGGTTVQNSAAATYTSTSLTNGQVVDVIVTNSSGCTRTSTGITNTVNILPIISTQPLNYLKCEGSIETFNVVASGTGLTYLWQRKLPTDSGFITIPVEANVNYPTPDKIRIQNIGSSLSPNGTQYRVIVSNSSGCSVTSTSATLSVNEITNVTGGTNVTQCYGTNYSYTVSTSYPSNVVSYQWKSSVTSGIWNDVIDGIGTPFTGAQTATLNIINGTPAESAEYRVYITFTSSGADCNVTSASRTRKITFLPFLNTPVTSVTQPTCSTSTGTITVTVQSASDVYSFDNGLTYQGINNVKSGLATGNYNIIIKNTQNCVSPTTTAIIDPQPITPIQPTLSLAALPTCNSLGSFTITNYNASYSYTVSPNIGVSLSGNTVTATAGNYSVIATLGSCSSISSASINVPTLVTKTWDGVSWSPNAPTSDDIVIINGNYNTTTINPILNACSLIVNSLYKLTVEPETSVIIQNDLTVNGTLDVLDKGSLIMVNDSGIVTNNGTTTVHRFTSEFQKFDYVYWSTPVASTNIPSTFLGWRTNYAFEFLPANFIDSSPADSFDDDGNDWSYASTMSPGKGYIVMVPTNKAMYPSVEEIVFSGKVNNGVITAPIALTPSIVDPKDDFNLVGNPYPSAIDAKKFILANINSNLNTGSNKIIDGTLYFWTHIGDISNTNGGPDGLNFSTNDYAVYTLAGGVQAGFGGTIPNGFIASGQGFFVEADNAGSLFFNNAMRLNTETKNNQFYKLQSNNKKSTVVSKDRLWLNLQNTSNLFSQQLIGYFDNATLGYDKGYDGLFSDAGNYINFYSFIDNDTYKIQGRSSFDENDQVRLGYSSKIAGTFTIAIDTKEGVFTNSNQAVYLEDKVTNTIFDLKNGAYSFTTEKGTFNDRFILRYTDRTLGVNEVNKEDGILVFYSKNSKMLTVKNEWNNSTIRSIALYSISGQNISNWNVENRGQNMIQIPIKNNSSGIYIVKVKTSEGEISKKISID